MVHDDRFKNARAFTERMKNLNGVRVGRNTINNWCWARGYHARKTLRTPLLTANHRWFHLDWERRRQNLLLLLGSMPSGEMSHVFSCTLSMAIWEFIYCSENVSSNTVRLPGSKLEGLLSITRGHSTGVPNPPNPIPPTHHHHHRHHPHTPTSMNSVRPCWISGQICQWIACSIWWPACPDEGIIS